MSVDPSRLVVLGIGDSLVQGYGDDTPARCGDGWFGRLVTETDDRLGSRIEVVAHGLGVAGETSVQITRRVVPLLPGLLAGADAALVALSFGTNDSVPITGFGAPSGPPFVSAGHSVDATVELLDALTAQLPQRSVLLWVDPPPVADELVTTRTDALVQTLSALVRDRSGAVVDARTALYRHPGYLDELRAGDGAHPRGRGYDDVADLVRPGWDGALASLGL